MNLFLALILLVIGLVILWKGADLLVAGAVNLAERLGISPLIVGLTVVAMGTSAPEAASSIAAVLKGPGGGDIAIGNVFGSNIANLALVGGLVALIRPLIVQKKTLLREVPVMLFVALLLWPLLRDMEIGYIDSMILILIFIVFIIYAARTARKESKQSKLNSMTVPISYDKSIKVQKSILFILIGLIGLAGGAKMTVEGALFIGNKIGISDGVVGLTFIALGTSLPELVTCVMAAAKGHHDISVGNLVGSNIFNTLLVTGVAGLVKPYSVSGRFAGGKDFWIMIIVSAAFAFAAIIGKRTISRISGIVLISVYAGYIIYLFHSGS